MAYSERKKTHKKGSFVLYTPDYFKIEDSAELFGLMRQNSFATLLTAASSLTATHLPFHVDDSLGALGTLTAHMAKANPQWEEFSTDDEALVIFQGPHAYVSPSMYASANMVPTWNYAVVHAYGRPEIVSENELLEILKVAVTDYETGRECPWAMETLSDDFISKLSRAIVGFKIEITRIEGKYKMSQNRSKTDQLSVIEGLQQAGGAPENDVAQWMLKNVSLKPSSNGKFPPLPAGEASE